MRKRKHVNFYCLSESTFVKEDLRILSGNFEVTKDLFLGSFNSTFFIPLKWLIQFLKLCFSGRKVDLYFGWFVDYHLLIPALFSRYTGKPLVVVLGGFDTVNLPQWNYGVFSGFWRRQIAGFIYKQCSLILPVSKALIKSENQFTFYPENTEFGLKTILEDELKAKIIPLYTGYDPEYWEFSNHNRNATVTTVGLIDSPKRIWIKGIDLFLEAALHLPEAEFRIVGVTPDMKEYIFENYQIGGNVLLEGTQSREELKNTYEKTNVYVQLSRLEGLPNVVCEAMLCGCIPVGSKVFGISEIISDEKYLIETPEMDNIVEKIKSALQSTPQDRDKMRVLITDKFNAKLREERLTDLVDQLSSS